MGVGWGEFSASPCQHIRRIAAKIGNLRQTLIRKFRKFLFMKFMKCIPAPAMEPAPELAPEPALAKCAPEPALLRNLPRNLLRKLLGTRSGPKLPISSEVFSIAEDP